MLAAILHAEGQPAALQHCGKADELSVAHLLLTCVLSIETGCQTVLLLKGDCDAVPGVIPPGVVQEADVTTAVEGRLVAGWLIP